MFYNEFKGKKLSALGFGCMRLPVIDGKDASIDKEATSAMVEKAMKSGINYYDTAYGYHQGNSELVMGEILKNYPRDSFYLATKFPGYDLGNMDKVEEIFERQLQKLQVEYFDFYLIHNVCEMNVNQYLDPKYGIKDYLLKQVENGRIKHLGFSVHAEFDSMMKFMEVYGEHMEFCQIQLNYLDWDFQEAKKKVEYLNSKNIPVWVMEPLRGGKLVNFRDEEAAIVKNALPGMSLAEIAFGFVSSTSGVTMTLSGMSNMEQLEDNLRIFDKENALSGEQRAALLDAVQEIIKRTGVPCTACRYCTKNCPQQIDIPDIMSLYNEEVLTGGSFIAIMKIATMPEGSKPKDCIACKACETVCPQQIKISEVMSDFAARLKK